MNYLKRLVGVEQLEKLNQALEILTSLADPGVPRDNYWMNLRAAVAAHNNAKNPRPLSVNEYTKIRGGLLSQPCSPLRRLTWRDM